MAFPKGQKNEDRAEAMPTRPTSLLDKQHHFSKALGVPTNSNISLTSATPEDDTGVNRVSQWENVVANLTVNCENYTQSNSNAFKPIWP